MSKKPEQKPLQASALYKTPDEMQKKINAYFKSRSEKKPPTMSGLALYLGFTDRRSIYDYEYKDQFSHTIKQARLRLCEFLETQLLSGQGGSGAIFMGKNMGYSDRQEIQHTTIDQDGKETGFNFVEPPAYAVRDTEET